MPLLKPPHFQKLTYDDTLMFLIGPIQGTDDWQNPTARWFLERIPNLYVASPRSEMWDPGLSREERNSLFALQADWEHQYIEECLMRIAIRAENVVIFAWCAKETEHDPRRAFAQTTRFELGTILGWLDGHHRRYPFSRLALYGPIEEPVFIGADPEFPGRRYLRHALLKKERVLYSSLDELKEVTKRYLWERLAKRPA